MFTTDAVAGSFAKNATVEWWLPVGGFGNIRDDQQHTNGQNDHGER